MYAFWRFRQSETLRRGAAGKQRTKNHTAQDATTPQEPQPTPKGYNPNPMKPFDLQALLDGNRRALAKAITLVESKLDSHREQAQQILEQVLPHSGNSIRIGITGVPGVGKSTFIEAFGLYLISQGKRVAVLAVDPSSPIAGGSILGDKTRMEELSRREEAFIRPSPAEGNLGGVAQKTRETMLLYTLSLHDALPISPDNGTTLIG